jgi:hypothetical protein
VFVPVFPGMFIAESCVEMFVNGLKVQKAKRGPHFIFRRKGHENQSNPKDDPDDFDLHAHGSAGLLFAGAGNNPLQLFRTGV